MQAQLAVANWGSGAGADADFLPGSKFDFLPGSRFDFPCRSSFDFLHRIKYVSLPRSRCICLPVNRFVFLSVHGMACASRVWGEAHLIALREGLEVWKVLI